MNNWLKMIRKSKRRGTLLKKLKEERKYAKMKKLRLARRKEKNMYY